MASVRALEAFKKKLDNSLPDILLFGFLHWAWSLYGVGLNVELDTLNSNMLWFYDFVPGGICLMRVIQSAGVILEKSSASQIGSTGPHKVSIPRWPKWHQESPGGSPQQSSSNPMVYRRKNQFVYAPSSPWLISRQCTINTYSRCLPLEHWTRASPFKMQSEAVT